MNVSERRAELNLARHAIDRRRALDAGAKCFSHNGFDGSPIAAIAREAGLSLKALYAAFPSKEDLFEAVIADRYDKHVLPLLTVDRTSLPPAERVFALVNDILAAMVADRAFMQLYARGSAGVPAKLRMTGRDPYTPYVDAVRTHLAGVIANCPADVGTRNAHDLAVALAASLVALATDAFVPDPPRPARDVGATLRQLFGPALGLDTHHSTTD